MKVQRRLHTNYKVNIFGIVGLVLQQDDQEKALFR